jgi:hypothetical protein
VNTPFLLDQIPNVTGYPALEAVIQSESAVTDDSKDLLLALGCR